MASLDEHMSMLGIEKKEVDRVVQIFALLLRRADTEKNVGQFRLGVITGYQLPTGTIITITITITIINDSRCYHAVKY